MRRCAAVLGTLAVFGVLVLSGCSAPSEATTAGSRTISTVALTPPPPPNDLTDEQVAQITLVQCPGAITEDVVRALVQPQADAVEFFATTLQCGDIAAVIAAGEGAPAFVSPMQYIDAPCPAGTVFTVWAHYDDDLIFGSPSIPQALDAGQCVRNLYLTGSDAGMGLDYAYGREDGLRAAYDVMIGAPLEWEQRTVALANGLTLAMSRPVGDPRVTLFFLRLPDGGLGASGFPATGWTSLPQLLAGNISELHMIDSGAAVSLDGISATIAELYNAYQPVMVMAHLPGSAQGTNGDHPDHQVTGDIVMRTADAGQIDPARVIYAQGYPSESRPQNLSGDVLQRKLDAFAAYAVHDPVIHCSNADSCANVRHFGAWLLRQYPIPHSEIVRP